MIGLMSALCYIAFTFMQIKIPTPGGATSFHLGNTFCVLAALLLGGIPGGAAGAIGMGNWRFIRPNLCYCCTKDNYFKNGDWYYYRISST